MKLLCAILLIVSLAGAAGTYVSRDETAAVRAQAQFDRETDDQLIAQMQRAIGDLMVSTSSTDPSPKSAAFAKAYCAQDAEAMWAALDPEVQARFASIYGGDGKAGLSTEASLDGCVSAHFGGSYIGTKGLRAIYIYTFATPDGAESTYFIITSSPAGVVGLE